MRLLLICVCFFTLFAGSSSSLFAQKPNEKYQYHIFPAASDIRVDGIGSEAAWQNVDVAKDFFMVQPVDTSFSRAKTEVRMTYDKQNLYILVTNFKPVPGTLIVESLRRDFSFNKNDNFLLFMDTFNDRTNGFSFGSNAAGAPWDGQQYDGAAVNLSWDNRWQTAVKNDDEKWVWEAAIPFKSIRYKPGITTWDINFSRLDLTIAEKSAWAPVPRQFATASLAYTRRVGLGVPILYGARLSGKLNKNWRVGVLNVQTSSQDSLPGQNFAVVALQRQVFARSNVRLMMVNKDAIHYRPELNGGFNRYNRNVGAEFNLASVNNLWTGKLMFLKSFTPNRSGDDLAHAADITYANTHFAFQWQQEYVGSNYNAEVGYVPNAIRNGYYKVSPRVEYLFFVKSNTLISHGPRLQTTLYWNKQHTLTDNETVFLYSFNFKNRGTASVWTATNYVRLLRPFDPTNSGREKLATGTEHHWKSAGFEFNSSPKRNFTYTLSTRVGGYYQGGERTNFSADLGYRFQPYVALTLSSNYNNILLPAPWNRVEYWLVGPRVDVTFRNNLFLTTFVQYNNQADNINLNTRLQWRYKPASDLFIVYTDNYLPENFHVKTRALVIKFTYWWNV